MEKKLELLIVEDNLADQVLFQHGAKTLDEPISLHFVKDGTEALRFLDEEQTLPDLVMLDLNMPKKDGREVLREIKGNAQLKHIPVIVLSTSNSPGDVAMAHELGATAYMVKPSDYQQYIGLVRQAVEHFRKSA
jgi:two-component system response regulator